MSRILSLAVAGLIAGVPILYSSQRDTHFRNFRVVTPGVLYRSGQLTPGGLKRLVHDYGIRTVVTLREGVKPDDVAEEEFCKSQGVRHVRITPKVWTAGPDGVVPGDENVRAFLAVADDPANLPVLVHCFAGMHRTGAYCAVYRMEKDRWSNDKAMEEMRQCGYVNLDREEDVFGYLEAYTPRWRR